MKLIRFLRACTAKNATVQLFDLQGPITEAIGISGKQQLELSGGFPSENPISLQSFLGELEYDSVADLRFQHIVNH